VIDKARIAEVLGQTLVHAHFREAHDELGIRIAELLQSSVSIIPLLGLPGSGRTRLIDVVKTGFGANRPGQLPDPSRLDIVTARAPTSANEAALVAALLTGLGYNATGRQSLQTLKARLATAIAHAPIRLFMLDDFNQCVERCSRTELLHLTETLADLCKTFRFGLLLSMTPRSSTITRDFVGSPRGWQSAVELRSYDWNKTEDRREFARSVRTLVAALNGIGLTFELQVVDLIRRLYGLSAGLIGELVVFLMVAAHRADRGGRIGLNGLREAAKRHYPDRMLSTEFLADETPEDLGLIRRHVMLLGANGIQPTPPTTNA
jgi:hypothetical protein